MDTRTTKTLVLAGGAGERIGCTVARPVAVRGLPVLGLNARGSGHHYRQEV
jgi:hypothetical protein